MDNANACLQHLGLSDELADAIIRVSQDYGYKEGQWEALPYDCSTRRYLRLSHNGESRVLMYSSIPDPSFQSFYHVSHFLQQQGLRSPAIYDYRPEQHLMLLEDFGDDTLSRFLSQPHHAHKELGYYHKAIETLLTLHHIEVQPVPHWSADLYWRGLMQFVSYYPRYYLGATLSEDAIAELHAVWQRLYAGLPPVPDTVALRDYHADNLMCLSEDRPELGLLDFQDALMGPAVYDIVSLLEDARRDVHPDTVAVCKDFYCDNSPFFTQRDHFEAHYALFGAHRNLRILGLWARMVHERQRPRYEAYIPRTHRYACANLQHPELTPLRRWMERYLPSFFNIPMDRHANGV